MDANLAIAALWAMGVCLVLLTAALVVCVVQGTRVTRDLTDKLVGMAEPRVLQPLMNLRSPPHRIPDDVPQPQADAAPPTGQPLWSEEHARDFGSG